MDTSFVSRQHHTSKASLIRRNLAYQEAKECRMIERQKHNLYLRQHRFRQKIHLKYGEENGRLHFHALVNVPDGEMVGSLTSTRRYSTKRKCWEESCENSFFRVRFGVNQFDAIRHQDIRSGKMVNYILKYLLKSGEKIVYSRGVPTDFLADLGDEEIAAELVDFVRKFVLFDDTFTLWSEPDTDTEDPEVNQTE